MKILYKIAPMLLLGSALLCCSEDDNLPNAASLKVIHTAVDVAPVHVNYFGRSITFSNNPTLSYGSSNRFTLPVGEDRDIVFVSSEDTASQVHQQTVSFEAGGIGTLFLTGQGSSIDGLFLNDELLSSTDSLAGVRFVNLSPDSQGIRFEAEGAGDLSNLSFRDATAFLPLDATSDNASYAFEVKNAAGDVLTTFSTTVPVFKNITLAVIGLVDDGQGGSTLSVVQVNSF